MSSDLIESIREKSENIFDDLDGDGPYTISSNAFTFSFLSEFENENDLKPLSGILKRFQEKELRILVFKLTNKINKLSPGGRITLRTAPLIVTVSRRKVKDNIASLGAIHAE